MKRWLCAVAVCAMSAAVFASDVGVAVSVGQPGFYGRIEIGNLPPPQLVYAHPIVVQPVQGVVATPIYLHVPPGHAKNWRKHCAHYNACGQPVYFVQDSWYNDVYVVHHRGGYRALSEPVAIASPVYEYRPAPQERLYEVPVTSV